MSGKVLQYDSVELTQQLTVLRNEQASLSSTSSAIQFI